MAPFPVGQNHDAGPSLANHLRDFKTILPRVIDPSIRDVERLPPLHAHNVRGVFRLAGAVFRAAPGAHLALSEIENSGSLSALHRFQQRTAARLLYIIAMRGNGEYIEGRR